jgi:hypothetical protein
MLKWDQIDVTNFFGVEATLDEACHSWAYELTADGLRLLVTLFGLEGAVYVSIFREGLVKPLCTVQRELCTHAHITKDREFRLCFEAGSPKHPVTDMGIPPVLVRGIRVYVTPHFQVELIQPRYDAA